MSSLKAEIKSNGFAVVARVLDAGHITKICAQLEAAQGAGVRRKAEIFAIRDVFETLPATRDLVTDSPLRELATRVLGADCFAMRGLLFDKNPGANWKVPWHQDLTIAVREKIETPGFGPWSLKNGTHHVQPPLQILQNMIALRLHLDDCDSTNGALRVLPASHRAGRLDAIQINDWKCRGSEVFCAIEAAGVLVMRPLVLHASSPAATPRHRRVLHFEFAAQELPNGLQWRYRIR